MAPLSILHNTKVEGQIDRSKHPKCIMFYLDWAVIVVFKRHWTCMYHWCFADEYLLYYTYTNTYSKYLVIYVFTGSLLYKKKILVWITDWMVWAFSVSTLYVLNTSMWVQLNWSVAECVCVCWFQVQINREVVSGRASGPSVLLIRDAERIQSWFTTGKNPIWNQILINSFLADYRFILGHKR